MGFETSSFTFVNPPASNPNAVLEMSALWPLQSAMRNLFYSAINGSQLSGSQIARVIGSQNDVEALFAQYPTFSSYTKLRDAIYATLDPENGLDLSDDPVLLQLQTNLLALPDWSDTLPT